MQKVSFQDGKMKKKQLIGIIVTAIVIVAVGITGVVSNVVAGTILDNSTKETTSWWKDLMSDELSSEVTLPSEEFIGVLNIVGTIQESSSS